MSRFSLLEREINKGVDVEASSGSTIAGWSPNNVKTLIIGATSAIVLYHQKGGKYKNLTEVVRYGEYLESDIELLETQPTKVRRLIDVLALKRVCSSVEEIIFCGAGYPESLLHYDSDIQVITDSYSVVLDSRFPRLRAFTYVDVSIEQLGVIVQGLPTPATELIRPSITEQLQTHGAADVHAIHGVDNPLWFTKTALRPKYYPFDTDVLQPYFEKDILAQHQRYQLTEHYRKAQQSIMTAFQKEVPLLVQTYQRFLIYLTQMDHVHERSPVLSKLEWAHVLATPVVLKEVRKEFQRKDYFPFLRQIDYKAILLIGKEMPELEEHLPMLEQAVMFMRQEIISPEGFEEYKAERNRLDPVQSIEALHKTLQEIVYHLSFITFLGLVKCLTRNTVHHMDFYLKQLKEPIEAFVYCEQMIRYCKKTRKVDSEESNSQGVYRTLEELDAKHVVEFLGAVEIPSKDYTFEYACRNLDSWLVSLGGRFK